ncbi:Ubiquitin-related modifier 1 [Zalaria obscura]|uniref:Ubiquitin-related modifier 1 n=1 Tax=Zalaria obscura TaxID=2024903 RepID=A0ACC3SPS3_9PEZI
MADNIDIKVEFTGGLEMLFSDKRNHKISLPAVDSDGQPANVAFLIKYLCENVMKSQKKDLFVLDGSVRPGILVLINDADWELEGEDQYELQAGDNVVFVSTLHGG